MHPRTLTLPTTLGDSSLSIHGTVQEKPPLLPPGGSLQKGRSGAGGRARARFNNAKEAEKHVDNE